MGQLTEYINREILTDGKFVYNCGYQKFLKDDIVYKEYYDIAIIGIIGSMENIELPTHFLGCKIKIICEFSVYKKSNLFPENITEAISIPMIINKCFWNPTLRFVPDPQYLISTVTHSVTFLKIGNTHLETSVFENQLFEAVIFTSSPNEIPSKCFYNCKYLNKVVLTNNTRIIRSYAFAKCKELKTISISKTVTEISAYAFQESGLKFILLPPNLQKIKQYTFLNCKNLKFVIVPPSANKISKSVFHGCPKVKIIALTNSYAHTFAKDNNIKFLPLELLSFNTL